ncbi:hypothetical protein ACOLZ1_001294 [Vibrio fluvialis]
MKVTLNKILVAITLFMPFASNAGEIELKTLCTATSWKAADNVEKCKTGQKIAFLPSSFGNEQLPIMFIALNCDLRFSVSLTKGGAVCVFNSVQKVVE